MTIVTKTFAPSNYKFTDPIRFFKASDPIYYEIDNIPLKQLHENSLWMKDQFDQKISIDGITRDDFNELKPYCTGLDNKVRVKPGRFSGRVNDAFSQDSLQIISNITGANLPVNYTWQIATLNNILLNPILQRFKNSLLPLNMNGLTERVLTYPSINTDVASPYVSGVEIQVTLPTGFNPGYPNVTGQLWKSFPAISSDYSLFTVKQYDKENPSVGFAALGVAESAFIKKWRGIARTAIVDIPTELELEIPLYDATNDFFYTDSSGTRVGIESNQRIDLLFIYTKPVDVSKVTIAKFSRSVSVNTPRVITEPKLGIVRGAGIGMNYSTGSSRNLEVIPLVDSLGNTMILPAAGDSLSPNSGFTIISQDGSVKSVKGSFPSPDDLMNLAPMLSENIAGDNFYLIGQSILPIAYIVVDRNTIIDNIGTQIIPSTSIIDIRPFFRTTELAYNERAGLAAAIPALSLANPVATQAELTYQIGKIYTELASRMNSITPSVSGTGGVSARTPEAKILKTGYVRGGYFYGVEGVLGDFIVKKLTSPGASTSISSIKQRVRERHNILETIDDLPDWDIANWCSPANGIDEVGLHLNDRINSISMKSVFWSNYGTSPWSKNGSNEVAAGMYGYLRHYVGTPEFSSNLTTIFNPRSTPQFQIQNFYGAPFAKLVNRYNFNQSYGDLHLSKFRLNFVKKRIRLNRSQVNSWMVDYNVNVQLWNCGRIIKDNLSVGGKDSFESDRGSLYDPTPFANETVGALTSMLESNHGRSNYDFVAKGRPDSGSFDIWVDKYPDFFNIYVSWISPDPVSKVPAAVGSTGGPNTVDGNYFWDPVGKTLEVSDIRDYPFLNGFIVINEDIYSSEQSINAPNLVHPHVIAQPGIGFTTYPTVSFQIIGIPESDRLNIMHLNNPEVIL